MLYFIVIDKETEEDLHTIPLSKIYNHQDFNNDSLDHKDQLWNILSELIEYEGSCEDFLYCVDVAPEKQDSQFWLDNTTNLFSDANTFEEIVISELYTMFDLDSEEFVAEYEFAQTVWINLDLSFDRFVEILMNGNYKILPNESEALAEFIGIATFLLKYFDVQYYLESTCDTVYESLAGWIVVED